MTEMNIPAAQMRRREDRQYDRPHHRKWWTAVIVVGAVYAIFLGSFVWLLWIDRQPFAVVASGFYGSRAPQESADATTTIQAFAPGESIFIYRKYCLSRNIRLATIRRWLFRLADKDKHLTYAFPTLAFPPNVLEEGCHELQLPIVTPEVPPGDYVISAQFRVEVNVLRDELIDVPDTHVRISGEGILEHFRQEKKTLDDMRAQILAALKRQESIEQHLTALRQDFLAHVEIEEREERRGR
jgi:hypothetical protein